MAVFRFALDPLLRIRRHREESAQRVLADLERERAGIEDQIRRHQEVLAAGRESLRGSIVGRVDIAAVRGQSHASIHLMRRAHQAVLLLAGTHRRIEQARAVLLNFSRERRAIELLRDRRLAEWNADTERRDLASIDEIAVIRAGRREESA